MLQGGCADACYHCEDERCFQEALCNAIEEWKEATNHQDVSCICFDSSEELLTSWEGGLSAELLFGYPNSG